jgi:uncharacterized membrane-anchored protein
MREQKVDALVVVFSVEGITSLSDNLITCITSSVEEAQARLWDFRLDGHGFTSVTPTRVSKAKVVQVKMGQMIVGSHHIY